MDSGEIETVAHLRGAQEMLPGVEFILDIGGQDMKCLRVKDGVIAVSYTHLDVYKRQVLGRADHAGVLGHGDERAGQAADGRRSHDAALLHGVVQHLSLIHI